MDEEKYYHLLMEGKIEELKKVLSDALIVNSNACRGGKARVKKIMSWLKKAGYKKPCFGKSGKYEEYQILTDTYIALFLKDEDVIDGLEIAPDYPDMSWISSTNYYQNKKYSSDYINTQIADAKLNNKSMTLRFEDTFAFLDPKLFEILMVGLNLKKGDIISVYFPNANYQNQIMKFLKITKNNEGSFAIICPIAKEVKE